MSGREKDFGIGMKAIKIIILFYYLFQKLLLLFKIREYATKLFCYFLLFSVSINNSFPGLMSD